MLFWSSGRVGDLFAGSIIHLVVSGNGGVWRDVGKAAGTQTAGGFAVCPSAVPLSFTESGINVVENQLRRRGSRKCRREKLIRLRTDLIEIKEKR
jgi:hypothetical protein